VVVRCHQDSQRDIDDTVGFSRTIIALEIEDLEFDSNPNYQNFCYLLYLFIFTNFK
jgi:hypothetical protein